jgi:glyoxylase-like metal-dependent hydrolase (beta-lactamase superfamily II)
MNNKRISEHGLQLTRAGFVNCYLVEESDGFTLIDTGLAGWGEWILAVATENAIPIRRIALTHAHVDHIGSVDELTAVLLEPEVAASARSLPMLQQPANLALAPGEPQGKIRGGTPGMKSSVTHVLSHGELYGSLRVIDTPGHIPGHISFLDERDGTLYAGDAFLGLGGLTVNGYGTGLLSIFNNFTWNKEWALESARRLKDYQIRRFAAGHGAVRDGGPKTLRLAVEKAESLAAKR